MREALLALEQVKRPLPRWVYKKAAPPTEAQVLTFFEEKLGPNPDRSIKQSEVCPYWVSNLGEVVSNEKNTLRVIKPWMKTRFPRIMVADQGYRRLSQIVLHAFVGPPQTLGDFPIHLDGVGYNCALSNLRWPQLNDFAARYS